MFTSPFGNIMQGITVVEWKQRQNLRKIHLFCSLHWLKNCKRMQELLLSFVSLPPHKPIPHLSGC